MVDLANVDNTTDALKPVSAATTMQLNLRTDKTTTDNSAVAWSAGLTSDAYHYITTGTDSLIKTATNTVSANFFGDNAGTLKGKALFYKDVEVMGSLINNGTNLLTSLNSKNAILTGAADSGSQSFLSGSTVKC